MLASVPTAMEAAEQAARSANQASLFGDDSGDVVAGELAKVAPWDLHKKLTEEKSALGYYYSGHLFDAWRDEVRRIPCSWRAWSRSATAMDVRRAGRRAHHDDAPGQDGVRRAGRRHRQVEISVFNELYEKHRNRLREDQLIIVQGKVSNDDYSGGMRVVADQLYDLQLAREARASRCASSSTAALTPRGCGSCSIRSAPSRERHPRRAGRYRLHQEQFPVHGPAGRGMARAHGRRAVREPERLDQADGVEVTY